MVGAGMVKKYSLEGLKKISPLADRYEQDLNPQQLAAVTAGDSPVLVIAGAGSGKTRTITYRVAWLLDSGVKPERIMLVTFTNKAAREMLHRVEHLVSSDARRIWGGTFHHIGNVILRRYAPLLGYSNGYTILDREDSRDLFNLCISEAGVKVEKKRFPTAKVLVNIAGFSTSTGYPLQTIVTTRYPAFVDELADIEKVIVLYHNRKRKLDVMDFDDLLVNWRDVLVQHENIRLQYSENFLHVLVDEYQDTNKIQGEIIDLMGSFHRNIMVVGDDSQSIYSFRGAHFTNIMNFPERYPDARVFKLETNYRSNSHILRFTNAVIASNKKQFPKNLRAVKTGDFHPALEPLRDVHQQAEFVAQRILELRDEGIPLAEMAVLYRSHYHSMEVQMELTRRGIPFVVRSGLRFFERAHIKDVNAYLKILVNPHDELSWKRLLKMLPGVGNITAHRVWLDIQAAPKPFERMHSEDILAAFPRKVPPEWQKLVDLFSLLRTDSMDTNPGSIIQLVLQQGYGGYLQLKYPDYRERTEDLEQLASFARGFNSLRSFLSELALLGSVESETVDAGATEEEGIVLSTVHQAKGLEWQVVFIVWLADGRFPAARSLENNEDVEEERRLLYVASTRAEEQLYLCYPIISGTWRQAVLMKPSRFLSELSEDAYEKWIVDDEIELLTRRLEEQDYSLD